MTLLTIPEVTCASAIDTHWHGRDGAMLTAVVEAMSGECEQVFAEPNLTPPIVTAEDTGAYESRILVANPRFTPRALIKIVQPRRGLGAATYPETIRGAMKAKVPAGKVYPEGATTNSHLGVYNFDAEEMEDVFAAAEEVGFRLQFHGEDPNENPQRAEAAFIPRLIKIRKRFPRLRMAIEHVSSRAMVEWVLSQHDPEHVIASVTAHHLFLTTEDVRDDKSNISCCHNFCKPEAKTFDDRQAVREAVLAGTPYFVLGSDSAPHLASDKLLNENPPAGCFTAVGLIPRVARFFEQHGRLEVLPSFISTNASRFYQVFPATVTTFVAEQWEVPRRVEVPNVGYVVPQNAGEIMTVRAYRHVPHS
jgi:dihydroorotase